MTKKTAVSSTAVSGSASATTIRPDAIGDFLRWVDDQAEFGETLDDAIYEYSRANGLMWHLGNAENRSVTSQSQARVRVALPAIAESAPGKGDGRPEIEAGEFAHLTGTKLFPTEGKKASTWCEGVTPRPRKTPPVDGRSFPPILSLIAKANGVGDKQLTKDNPFIIDLAKMPMRRRDMIIREKTRDYTILAMKNSDIEELQGDLQTANRLLLEERSKPARTNAEIEERIRVAVNAGVATALKSMDLQSA
jgi:hypothetical protein